MRPDDSEIWKDLEGEPPDEAASRLESMLASDDHRKGELLLLRSQVAHTLRRHEERHRYLVEARSWARAHQQEELEASALAEMALPLGASLTHAERIRAGESAIAVAMKVGDPSLIAKCLSNLAFARVYSGSRSAFRMFAEAVEMFEMSHPELVLRSCWDWTSASFAFGDYPEAGRALHRASPFVSELSRLRYESFQALLKFRTGEWDEALKTIENFSGSSAVADFIPAVEISIRMERQSHLNLTRIEESTRGMVTPLHWLPFSAAVLAGARLARREPAPLRGIEAMLTEILESGRRVGWDELLVICARVGGHIWERALALLTRVPPVGLRAEGSIRLALAMRSSSDRDREARFREAAEAYEEAGEPYTQAVALKAAALTRLNAGLRAQGLHIKAAELFETLGAWRSLAELLRSSRGSSALRGIRLPPEGRRLRSSGLTRREEQVAELAAEGLSSSVIATELGISSRTVETHLSRIKFKLGVRRKSDLVRLARGRFLWDRDD